MASKVLPRASVRVGNGTEAARPPTFFRRHRWKIIGLGLVVFALGGAALWTLGTLAFTYSSGERIGYVQKFSRKGWICRTWEGELAMTPVPGAIPQIFPFTVRDDAVAARLAEAEGRKVSLHYEEKRGVPTTCFGETPHFVTNIRVLGN